jgi:integrase
MYAWLIDISFLAIMAPISPQKIPLTDKILGQLKFENRVVGLNPDGSLRTIPTDLKARDWFLRDASMPGFAVRVTRSGLRFYAERKLAGRPCRFDCGTWGDSLVSTSLTKARKTASAALAKMLLGQDPNLEKKKAIAEVIEERKKANITVGFIMDRDAQRMLKYDKDPTEKDRKDVKKCLSGMKIWRMAISDVKSDDLEEVMGVLQRDRGNTTSLKVWRYMRAAWLRLAKAETPPDDPFAEWLKTNRLPKRNRRQTSISTEERSGRDWLKAVATLRQRGGSRGFPHRVMADYLILTLCWGARKGEASRLKVADIDFEREFVVFRDTKTDEAHYFPLTPACAALLKTRIEDNNQPRGREVEKAAKGEPHYIPEWVFPSQRRGKNITNPTRVLEAAAAASGLKATTYDLRRGFAGAIAVDALVGENSQATGNFGLVKLAMNHADMKSDVTQGYIMVKPKLAILRPLYLAQERRVFIAAGLGDFLPEVSAGQSGLYELIALLKSVSPETLSKVKAILD